VTPSSARVTGVKGRLGDRQTECFGMVRHDTTTTYGAVYGTWENYDMIPIVPDASLTCDWERVYQCIQSSS